jgi:hypothetical protein
MARFFFKKSVFFEKLLLRWLRPGWSLWNCGRRNSYSECTVHAALKLRLNYIDTAPWYGAGKSEALLGKVWKFEKKSKFLIEFEISKSKMNLWDCHVFSVGDLGLGYWIPGSFLHRDKGRSLQAERRRDVWLQCGKGHPRRGREPRPTALTVRRHNSGNFLALSLF